METAFIGRKNELKLITHTWDMGKPSLITLYGRRRVGKTRLLTHWMRHHSADGMYWMADATSNFAQLRSFSRALVDFEDPEVEVPLDLTFPNWEYAFRRVSQIAKDRRIALFIDEVTYLMDVDVSIVGVIQKAWDQWLSKSNIMLALCGSKMGLMQRHMLSYDAPLYGRATAQIQLEPLRFGATSQFFPDYSPLDRVMVYTILGGIPAYWERMDPSVSALENLRLFLLPANNWMMDEARLLLQDFVSDPYNYSSIMEAIANGAHTYSDIEKRTGLSRGHSSQYLSLLRDTGFVQRQTPISDSTPHTSRRGRYYVIDPYLRFYYRYLTTYQSKIALGKHEQTSNLIEADLPTFIQEYTWPELCREWLDSASAAGELPFTLNQVGSDWKRTTTFNVAGINEEKKMVAVAVCIWNREPVDATTLREMVSRTKSVLTEPVQDWQVYYLGFAAGGWSESAQAEAKRLLHSGPGRGGWQVVGHRLLDLKEVDRDLVRWTL
ncbi:MAG: ATP-binding protein [Chloroflexi bacterium]|nr:ATP-binding protein [Chloroflexota bacterium]MBP8059950.1 ATP-binding protein [Chloroflexota bacterium]